MALSNVYTGVNKFLFLCILFSFSILSSADEATETLEVMGSRPISAAAPAIHVLNFINGGKTGALICEVTGYNPSWWAMNTDTVRVNSIFIDQTGRNFQFDDTETCRKAEAYIQDSRVKTVFTVSPKDGKIVDVKAFSAR